MVFSVALLNIDLTYLCYEDYSGSFDNLNFCKQFGPRSGRQNVGPDIWIRNVWHFDGIPDRIFQKS